MENIDDVTDDLLGLPGFVRRNLLLMRDLDLKSAALFNDANERTQTLYSNEKNTVKKSNDYNGRLSSSSTSSSVVSGKRDSDKGSNASSKTQKGKGEHEGKISLDANAKRSSSKEFTLEDTQNLSDLSNFNDEFDSIQKLRMDGIHILQEKLDVNNQITCMLKFEYENLKATFDKLYSRMDAEGKIPYELKMHISSNKKKNQSSLNHVDSISESEQTTKNSEHRTIAQHQLDIATMFKNISANSQNNWNPNKLAENEQEDTEQKDSDILVEENNAGVDNA